MIRLLPLLAALALVPAAALAQPSRPERDGPLSREELEREPIELQLDVPYAGTDDPRQRLDLYLPKQRKTEVLPVIVFIHGGAWMGGDRSDGAARLLPFVRSGRYAGVSVGYRLSREATWPAQIHDVKAAVRWVRANAGKYGLDPDRIAVWGRSAGGHLALMLGTSGDVPALEGDLGPHRGAGSRVSGVANFFGPTDFLAEIGQPSALDRTRPDAPEALLIGGPLLDRPATARAASPVHYVTPNDPPVLTVHGTDDRTVPYDQGVRIDAALRRAGVPSAFVTIEGGGHGDFGSVADDRLEAFFAKVLLGEDAPVSSATIDVRGR